MQSDAGRVHVSLAVIFLFIFGTTLLSGGPAKRRAAGKARAARAIYTAPADVEPFKVDLRQMAPPDTTGLPQALPPANTPYVWDEFAWQSFIAMNWPAIVPGEGNGYLRGFPDKAKDFVCAGDYDTPLVWETFKEKREVFNYHATTPEDAKPKPWSSDYDYGTHGADGKSKLLTQGINFVTLDETVEVASQAREAATTVPNPASTPVFARVYRGTTPDEGSTTDPGNAVRYEVKVNYDFYQYVVDNELYFDEYAYARSLKNPPIQLPWRTTLVSPGVKFYTQKPAKTSYIADYSAAKVQERYQSPAKGATPPGIGAVHLKAAWVPIQDADKEKFIHRTATYYAGDGQAREATFGLIGLHIIQRIKVATSLTGSNANPTPILNNAAIGGTFIYSTWEHIEVQPPDHPLPGQVTKTQPYQYENVYFDSQQKAHTDGPYRVERLYDILSHTQQANTAFWNQIKDVPCGENKKSVWLNYRLVGVQFMPVDIKTTVTDQQLVPTGQTDPGESSGLPNYLANLFVETNKGLQHFQGLPPGTSPTNQFTVLGANNTFYTGNLAGTFDHTKNNTAFGGSLYTMGGCMGCHGVAQLKGYSFSFVLLGGQAGAGVDSESQFDPPPPGVSQRFLLSGGRVSIQSRVQFGEQKVYLAIDDLGQPVYQPVADMFTVVGVNKDPGEVLHFGDPVYLVEKGSGDYLTATNIPGPDKTKVVSFQPGPSSSGAWILFDSAKPDSTAEIKGLENLSFKNAAITFPDGLGAYLSVHPEKGYVYTVNHAADARDLAEYWNLTRIR